MSHHTIAGPDAIPAPGWTGGVATAAAPQAGRSTKTRIHRSWEKWALFALLAATAVLYLWNITASGYANSFYSAAVQAGSESWRAFLYGCSDAACSITVDKPPASLWPMELSVRLFGLSSAAILIPQALMGVASVGTLYATVRRHFSAGAALLAGGILAITPVAALMFRFNNPDAMLVLVMCLAAYAVVRAIDTAHVRWMILAGALIGLGFLTKQLQAFLVLPGFALAYLIAAPVSVGKRIRDGLAALGAMVLAGGWWVALVQLVPAADRPYIGGSQDNSFVNLTFGYNGFGRLTGNETGSVGGGGGGGGGQWGSTGITRMFTAEIGGQISWLLPAALILLVVGLWLGRRAQRTDGIRAQWIVWGGWLVVTCATFSFMAGIFHAYYTIALAPAIAACVAMGTEVLWRRRDRIWSLGLLAALVVVTAGWSFVLLSRSPSWLPWLRWSVLIIGVLGAAAIVAGHWAGRAVLRGGAIAALVAILAGPAAYSVQTVSSGHQGSIVTAGPAVNSSMGGPGAAGGPGGQGGPGAAGGQMPGGGAAQGAGGNGAMPPPDGQGGQAGLAPPGMGSAESTQGGQSQMPGQLPGGDQGGEGGGGSLLNGSAPSTELTTMLLQNSDDYTWVAATVGSNSAAGYQLATQKSVMPIGGFNGTDPAPTLAQFTEYVSQGKIHYFIASGGGGGPQAGGSGSAAQITSWVEDNFTAHSVDGVTIYDLTS